MKILKDNIREEDKEYALDILNKLRAGDRVFGSPASALKKTLKKLEENAPAKDSSDSIVYNLNNKEYEENIAKLKKGIKGEEQLGEYFEKIVRLDSKLKDMVVIASLGDEDTDKDYIPDTDFLMVYGNNILTIDAKCINTNPEIPIFVSGNGIYSAINHEEPILEVNSSVPVWNDILKREYNGYVDKIDGCTVLINKTGAEIFKDQTWVNSDIKPIHISELVEFLHAWTSRKEPVTDLGLLVVLMKRQVWEAKSGLDLTKGRRMLNM